MFAVKLVNTFMTTYSPAYTVSKVGVNNQKYPNSKIKYVYSDTFDTHKTNEFLQESILECDLIEISLKVKDKCALYLKNCHKFRWFIKRWFGIDKYKELNRLAWNNEQSKLMNELDDIWFKLPDHIFNIIENPDGWKEFLNVIED